jgi:hypothetical protein
MGTSVDSSVVVRRTVRAAHQSQKSCALFQLVSIDIVFMPENYGR